jgi:tetratricopeptide (TPR) repeat protein
MTVSNRCAELMKKTASFWLMTILSSALALAAGNPQQTLAPEAAAKLSGMEAALATDPDNLRLGNDYRMAVIATNQYERCLQFFAKLVADHPNASNAYLNYAFAYVDKIPSAGSVTQVITANNALNMFTKSIELKPTWIGYCTRGKSYLYWPVVFDRTRLGVADLEEAMKIQKAEKKRSYHRLTYIFLGDGYWKMGNLPKAMEVWKEGLVQFPDNADLKARLSRQGDDLKALIEDALDYSKRVDTNLHELWGE